MRARTRPRPRPVVVVVDVVVEVEVEVEVEVALARSRAFRPQVSQLSRRPQVVAQRLVPGAESHRRRLHAELRPRGAMKVSHGDDHDGRAGVRAADAKPRDAPGAAADEGDSIQKMFIGQLMKGTHAIKF
eukprot:18182-Pelagococcus_subviridis.AAC.1